MSKFKAKSWSLIIHCCCLIILCLDGGQGMEWNGNSV